MIQRLEISGVHTSVDDKLHKYVTNKIGKLDRYMPKHARASAHAEVKLRESKVRDKKNCTCEIILYLPSEQLTVVESTMNMFAAVDIAEATLKNQLAKYKDRHSVSSHNSRRHLLKWWRRRRSTPEPESPFSPS